MCNGGLADIHNAAKVLLAGHEAFSGIPLEKRTQLQNDVAQMGRNRLKRIIELTIAKAVYEGQSI